MGKHATNEIRLRLVDMVFGKKFQLKVAAAALGLKYTTAHKILTTFKNENRIEKRKCPGREKQFGEPVILEIVRYLTVTHPDATLNQCRQHLIREKEALNHTYKIPSITTIDRILRSNKISLKALTVVPEQRNSEGTIELRKQYAIKYSRYEGSANFVFIDEFGCNISLRRSKGRSTIGFPATIEATGSRGNNLSVCAAIDIRGSIFHFAKYGAFNQVHFITFLGQLKDKLSASQRNILVFDNVAFHKTKDVQDFLKANSLKAMFLPPWSPMLNPIENCFSKVKALIKQHHSTSGAELFEAVNLAFSKVTATDCAGWFRRAKQYFPQCLNEQPIMVDPENELEVDEFDGFDSEDELVGNLLFEI